MNQPDEHGWTRSGSRRLRLGVVVAVALLSGSCQWLTNFELDPEAELTQALCEDGRDNDFDGFVDCQESSCARFSRCCDIPEVLLEDDFDGPSCADAECAGATCGALECGPSEERWVTWPCPFPKVCDGALRLDKQACYAQGVLSRELLPIRPGLSVEVDLLHAPEARGYLEVALTLQGPDEFQGALDECSAYQYVRGFAALRQERRDDGYELVAIFQSTEIGRSSPVTDPEVPHRATLRIDVEGRLFFELDGAPIASATVPVPEEGNVAAHLAISGLTQTAAVSHVRVEAGLRCEAPGQWQPAGQTIEESVALAPTGSDTFDASEVFYPSVAATPAGYELLYSGCTWTQNDDRCRVAEVGLGRAVGRSGRDFDRLASTPALSARDVFPSSAFYEQDVWAGELSRDGVKTVLVGGPGILGSIGLDPPQLTEILAKSGSGWDYRMCCPSAAVGSDGSTYLYYAGRGQNDSQSAIGLATLGTDGKAVRHPSNPIFLGSTSFDAAGSGHPSVLYDVERQLFRMWYETTDFFGRVGIGYATSVDGIDWQPFEGNPVLRAEDVGLVSMGAPSVLLTPDRRLLMWVDGTTSDNPRRRIFMLENAGTRIEDFPDE